MKHFALVTQSSSVTLEDCQAMAAAVMSEANLHFCPNWNHTPVSLAAYSGLKSVPAGSIVCNFVDTTAEQGALAWHDQANDLPVIFDQVQTILSSGGGVLSGGKAGYSVSSAFCHEVWETIADPYINDWIQMPDGKFLAKESADPVESISIPFTLPSGQVVLLSDGVFPRYFDAQATVGPFDLARVITKPFEDHAGGYQIILDPATGQVNYVWGAMVPEAIKLMKARESCRTQKRAAKFS